MNLREKVLNSAKNDADRLLMSKILDLINDCNKHYRLSSGNFLNGYEAAVARSVFTQAGCDFGFYGGYDEAERTIPYVYPEFLTPEASDLPISIIKITGRDIENLSHRDYLGSILALGIKREKIGDIAVNSDSAFVICISDIADYIMSQLRKIGNKGVKLELCDTGSVIIPSKEFTEKSHVVASLRLDAIISAICGVSRSDAADYIKHECVSVNWMPVSDVTFHTDENSLLSVKGHGRFLLYSVNGMTKKGRTNITVRHYI